MAAPVVPRGVALPLAPALGETHGVADAEPLAAADPPADAVAVPLRLVAVPLVALPLAEEVAARVVGLTVADAVAVPLRVEAVAEALADLVAPALAVGAHVTPAVDVLVDSLSLPHATAKVSSPAAIAIGIRARTSWRFINASFLFDCYLNIPNEHEACPATALNYNFITTNY